MAANATAPIEQPQRSSAPKQVEPVTSKQSPLEVPVAALPTPEKPTCVQAASMDPFRAVCRKGATDSECDVCPAFTGFSGTAGGRIEVIMDGSFASASAEKLLRLTGCESHADNWGGTVLLRYTDNGWVPVSYVAGFMPSHCEKHDEPDGHARLVCLEEQGLNSGTYITSAAVVDFLSNTYDALLEQQCESGIDVRSVHWLSPNADEIGVRIDYGMKRDNDGQSCHDVSGSKSHAAQLKYNGESYGYTPSPETTSILLKAAPADETQKIDPAVLRALGTKRRLPDELSPQRRKLGTTSANGCESKSGG